MCLRDLVLLRRNRSKDMTNKSLGEIAHDEMERQGAWSRPWSSFGDEHKIAWEAAAQAVAKQVAATCAKICEDLPMPNWDENSRYGEATLDCEAAIKEHYGLRDTP